MSRSSATRFFRFSLPELLVVKRLPSMIMKLTCKIENRNEIWQRVVQEISLVVTDVVVVAPAYYHYQKTASTYWKIVIQSGVELNQLVRRGFR